MNSNLESILISLQDGEISRARAAECLKAFSAGHFTRDWLPPHRAFFTEDETPVEVVQAQRQLISELRARADLLNDIVNHPQRDDFLRAVSTEAEHQRQRWPSDHDAGKTPADWFWLVGYLAGKALHAHSVGDREKAEHHVITTAAACANWHRGMFGLTNMRPGIEPPPAEHLSTAGALVEVRADIVTAPPIPTEAALVGASLDPESLEQGDPS